MRAAVRFRGMETDIDGLTAEGDLRNRFQEAINTCKRLPEVFDRKEAA